MQVGSFMGAASAPGQCSPHPVIQQCTQQRSRPWEPFSIILSLSHKLVEWKWPEGPPFQGLSRATQSHEPSMGPNQQWALAGSQVGGFSTTRNHWTVLATSTTSTSLALSTEPDEVSVNSFLSEGEREELLGLEEFEGCVRTPLP